MGPYTDNMNFQLKHLMREQLCVHNTTTWECGSEKSPAGPPRSGSPWVQTNTLFTKYPPSSQSQSWPSDEEALRGFHPEGRASGGKLGRPSHRVCPLQLQREGGRVGKVPGLHSPPGRRHRLGVRGHGGTAAPSRNRKWVWLQNRRCTLLVTILSQQPGGNKKRQRKRLESWNTHKRKPETCKHRHVFQAF